MNTFILEVFCKIIGIGAASGLVYNQSHLYLIADNSHYIYDYHLKKNQLLKFPLTSSEILGENIIKKEKADIEAISLYENTLFIYGSGSTAKRNKGFEVFPDNSFKVNPSDLTALYSRLQKVANISEADFNIEGAIVDQDRILLFNRGNGPQKRNVVFQINRKQPEQEILWKDIALPAIKTMSTGFTDAILHQGLIYFIAAAEDSNSNYHDGEIGGSLIGVMDAGTFDIKRTLEISATHKIEGLTFYEEDQKSVQFLLCEDRDNDEEEAIIYKLTLSK
ncbi:DUF6929 family protein [Sphingobacterium spiritivorum]|uniref:Phytase-like domain-containing protein n=1 Tax=Sphingobacterium spiritivorum ATCC 33861 TaxID=525373 RepID=D7VIS8_SPHSI|nr:hypothetical protein [Sphingobacterium spiritivorum]EFK59980.1 hypothetical protein HMPREF0766_10897 [Sphingobacterium spiritivorum ATCC 33861]QQT37388.1 hypothetical protein I6J01_08305 [Sphingobacterium spiritivorum]WQD34180.1 hypothetical protein U0038_00240 [Sphingobacterium spiritivorum]SUI97003.1 Uncharacterised protein [Sphingobacterium spiritivorum]